MNEEDIKRRALEELRVEQERRLIDKAKESLRRPWYKKIFPFEIIIIIRRKKWL